MRRRSLAVQAFCLLVLCGALGVALRYQARRNVRLGRADTAWRVTYSIEFEARQALATLRIASPADTRHCRVIRQDFRQANLRAFLTRRTDQPFCLVVALVEPHVPWVMGDVSQYPPGRLKLPPHIADTPKTRQDFASYLAEITYMDGQVGEILAALRQAEAEEGTLVLFSSEQGAQFPGCKWTN